MIKRQKKPTSAHVSSAKSRSKNPRKREAMRAVKTSTTKVVRASQRRPESPSIKPAGPLPPPTQQQGSDGIGGYGGYWHSGGETHPDLIGSRLWKTFAEVLANATIVATAVRYSLNLIGGVEWESTLNPHCKDQALAKKTAETVRAGLIDSDMSQPFPMHAKKQALHAWYGFALHNWFWRKRSDGLIVISDLRHRPQSTIARWDIPVEGEPWIGVEQQTRNGGSYYAMRSRLWYTADLSITDRPQGVGLLRHVVEHARQVQHLEEVEGYGFDANLRGVPIGRAPLAALFTYATTTLNMTDEQADSWVDDQVASLNAMLANHAKSPDQGMLLDSETYLSKDSSGGTAPTAVPKWAIDLLQGGDMGLAECAAAIERKTREIARVMSFEWALLGEGDAGSNAMHTDKTAQYGAFLNAITMGLAISARNDVARPLVAANHGAEAAEDATPIITPSQISTGAIRDTTGAILDMKQAGAWIPPDDPIFALVRKRMRAPAAMKIPPEVGGALLRPPMPPGFPGAPGRPPFGQPPAPAPGGKPDADPDQETDDLRQGGDPEAKDPKVDDPNAAGDHADDETKPAKKPAKKRKAA